MSNIVFGFEDLMILERRKFASNSLKRSTLYIWRGSARNKSVQLKMNKTQMSVLCMSTRFSWPWLWVSESCSSAALASTAALWSLSRRSASSWALVLSFSNSSTRLVCSSSSEKNTKQRKKHSHVCTSSPTPKQAYTIQLYGHLQVRSTSWMFLNR